MKNLKLDILIDASRETVWDSVVHPAKYRQWTTAFTEGSYFEGGWNKGDKILFLANRENKISGMLSEIAESRFPEYISIRHLGQITNGVADTESEEVKKWAPMYENYILEKADENSTRFCVEMDLPDEFYEMFLEMWPKALILLKKVSEENRQSKTQITIGTVIDAPVEKVWDYWTKPEHITQWNHASEDWHCPAAENDLRESGKFCYTMASKDGKMSFGFEGRYLLVKEHQHIHYQIADGRNVQISFTKTSEGIQITETFESENFHPAALQHAGWQSILDNFKRYVENN
jgi:uncharacterized protein YndB with AHSA1/START domain